MGRRTQVFPIPGFPRQCCQAPEIPTRSREIPCGPALSGLGCSLCRSASGGASGFSEPQLHSTRSFPPPAPPPRPSLPRAPLFSPSKERFPINSLLPSPIYSFILFQVPYHGLCFYLVWFLLFSAAPAYVPSVGHHSACNCCARQAFYLGVPGG